MTKNGGSNLVAVGFNKEACRKACMRMIILDELPFSFVEGEGFREFCSVACPKFGPPSRRAVARDIYQLYLDEKESLKRLFTTSRQRVCLTTDTWTSLQNVNYMVVKSHFINSEW
ncbi:hypothetical protein Dsin_016947 [Dipteronia sinensis]|uniref:Uncharacterized protein n=1 Tax=Dipteronia sinensis TaxID=43782 RepID=A0AAE0E5Y9_9ROSI|nr:hypothetical protein Dsin_016947 [Dipteronia sinensis]